MFFVLKQDSSFCWNLLEIRKPKSTRDAIRKKVSFSQSRVFFSIPAFVCNVKAKHDNVSSFSCILFKIFLPFILQQESGGTVLSTNWKEIGEKKVDVKPPDGMEYKQWDY